MPRIMPMSQVIPVPRRWALLVALAAALVLTLVGAPVAHACSCDPRTFEEAVEGTDLIADITIQHQIDGTDGGTTYYAAVDAVWQGETSRTIEFSTEEAIASCGLGELEDGTSLLVWASGADGQYSSSWCALPVDAGPDVRARLTQELGSPADLSDQPIPRSEHPAPFSTRKAALPLAILAGAGVLVAGAGGIAVGAVLLLRRRR